MSYPIANSWKSLTAVTVNTTAAQKVTAADYQTAGEAPLKLKWICYQPAADVLFGGPEISTAANGTTLYAGERMWVEAERGLGLWFRTSSGSTTMTVLLGFEA